jgi:hypothetical protein
MNNIKRKRTVDVEEAFIQEEKEQENQDNKTNKRMG